MDYSGEVPNDWKMFKKGWKLRCWKLPIILTSVLGMITDPGRSFKTCGRWRWLDSGHILTKPCLTSLAKEWLCWRVRIEQIMSSTLIPLRPLMWSHTTLLLVKWSWWICGWWIDWLRDKKLTGWPHPKSYGQ